MAVSLPGGAAFGTVPARDRAAVRRGPGDQPGVRRQLVGLHLVVGTSVGWRGQRSDQESCPGTMPPPGYAPVAVGEQAPRPGGPGVPPAQAGVTAAGRPEAGEAAQAGVRPRQL